MNDKNTVAIDVNLGLRLRAATSGDLNHLREWKNTQRQYFFYQNLISAEQQQKWFDSFVQRQDDYMLMVEQGGVAIGCMGIRLMDAEWDIYNVILGNASCGKQGHMGSALATMLQMARKQRDLPITLKVLRHNPAVGWYLKNGFITAFEADDHYGLCYQVATQKDTHV